MGMAPHQTGYHPRVAAVVQRKVDGESVWRSRRAPRMSTMERKRITALEKQVADLLVRIEKLENERKAVWKAISRNASVTDMMRPFR